MTLIRLVWIWTALEPRRQFSQVPVHLMLIYLVFIKRKMLQLPAMNSTLARVNIIGGSLSDCSVLNLSINLDWNWNTHSKDN